MDSEILVQALAQQSGGQWQVEWRTPSRVFNHRIGEWRIKIAPTIRSEMLWLYTLHGHEHFRQIDPWGLFLQWATIDDDGAYHIDLSLALQSFALWDPLLHQAFQKIGPGGAMIRRLWRKITEGILMHIKQEDFHHWVEQSSRLQPAFADGRPEIRERDRRR
eukprot:TRINITY_DN8819_c0_g1_i1.p1 TRINITY_DN8819_c0_g1~~TRINITY_DN8819_c0_g1_i1.p1  ORF type:complete len:162 (-),score=8.88 TRINITY_DN8819_c0_g1_i1:991-1476(-)